MSASWLGKIPTTSVRRASSRLSRSSEFVDRTFDQCSRGTGEVRDQIRLGPQERLGGLRKRRRDALDDRAELGVSGRRIGLSEDRPTEGGDYRLGGQGDVGQDGAADAASSTTPH